MPCSSRRRCSSAARAIPALGSVPSGNTVSDFEPEETHRKISVSSTVLHFTWKDTTFNLVDTPGALSLMGEARTALRGVDGVLIVDLDLRLCVILGVVVETPLAPCRKDYL